MSSIYDANTLRKVATDAELARLAHLRNDVLPELIAIINDNNFTAASSEDCIAVTTINLTARGLTDDKNKTNISNLVKNAFRNLGFKVSCDIGHDYLYVECAW